MPTETVTSAPVELVRRPVSGACPQCGDEQLAAYPVNSEGGWFDVVKCQACLHSVSRERGALLGDLHLLVDQM